MSVFPSPSSPTAAAPAAAPSGVPSPYPDALPGARLFRGRTLDELLPQIRAALGPDAVVVRRREGLQGGALGFFQSRFVEVEAVAGDGAPGAAADAGFDAYDDADAWPEDVSADGVRWLDEPHVAERPDVLAAPANGGPWAASADGIAPIDGAAFLRHLDAAVERRRATEGAAADDAGTPTAASPVRRAEDGAAAPAPPAAADPPGGLLGRSAAPAADRAGATIAPPPSTSRPAATPAVQPWAPARTYGRAGEALVPTRRIEAPGSGEVEPVAGPASGPLELRDTVVAERPAPRRRPAPITAAEVTVDPVVDGAPAPVATGGGGRPPFPGPDRVAAPARRAVDADVAEYGLVARGLSPTVARAVVGEAARHGQPLDPGHRMDRATRAALARRIPRTGPREEVRTIAVAGAPGAGRTAAAGALAAAHAGAGRRVLAVALGSSDAGAALAAVLAGSDADLLVASTGAAAAAAIRADGPDLCVVDTPAVRPDDRDAAAALAAELRALGPCETLLAVPGTGSTGAVHDVLDGLAPLGADALVMTHRDRAERPGGVIGASIVRGVPIAYVTDGRAIALADPTRLARMVQP